jgi:predicted extracellular nuclease
VAVYADLEEMGSRGFFIQDKNCGAGLQISDGFFVYLDEKYNLVASGDYVEVCGTVADYYGRTELVTDPDGVFSISEIYLDFHTI